MSYDEHDAAMDDMYSRISEEIYPEHRERAIEEFTTERFHAYYKQHSFVMRPAVNMKCEADGLSESGHFSAAVVFYTTAVEILLKATILKPVILGLIHNENLADVIVKHALAGTGFDRYSRLLSQLFDELASMQLNSIARENGKPLLQECAELQELRNGVIHRGEIRTVDEAVFGKAVANAVFHLLVGPMLSAIGLSVVEGGEIRETTGVYGKRS